MFIKLNSVVSKKHSVVFAVLVSTVLSSLPLLPHLLPSSTHATAGVEATPFIMPNQVSTMSVSSPVQTNSTEPTNTEDQTEDTDSESSNASPLGVEYSSDSESEDSDAKGATPTMGKIDSSGTLDALAVSSTLTGVLGLTALGIWIFAEKRKDDEEEDEK